MNRFRSFFALFVLFCVAGSQSACSYQRLTIERNFYAPHQWHRLDSRTQSLKVHTTNGELFVLHVWKMAADSTTLTGQGAYYDQHRQLITRKMVRTAAPQSYYTIPIAEIATLETNVLNPPKNKDYFLIALSTVTGVFAVVWYIILFSNL